MIFAQEQEFLKANSHLKTLIEYICHARENDERIDKVERTLFQQLLKIGHLLLEGFIQAAGDGDAGKTLTVEGRSVGKLDEPHRRRYVSIFGEHEIRRCVYAAREGQRIEVVPLDEKLSLPAGEFSYVLEDWLQRLCVKEAFAEATGDLKMFLGQSPSVRSSEAMNRWMAQHAEPFREAQPAPPTEQEGEILVFTADGKGVPMCRSSKSQAGSKRRRKGEKANKKQMAYVGAVYSIDRFVRTADDVLSELSRKERSLGRPQPRHKRVWAEMTPQPEGKYPPLSGRTVLFAKMADQLVARNPCGGKPTVCLMDGERALWEVKEEYLRAAVGILDIFHVSEKLWEAAHCFYAEDDPNAERFVEKRLRMLLEGQVRPLISDLRRLSTRRKLAGRRRTVLRKVIGYLKKNQAHMGYDEYLAAGYPIGSGVVEGACRHLVKDRLEQTGMRWTVTGAQSMLDLRSLYLNGDWDEFVEYHICEEQKLLYGSKPLTHISLAA